ncbi:MAG: hypothetical protein JWR38_1851 [Mucilaginibacter sp.]|nr:hypothetical protein [Mucilaginibacter sp.]
MDYIFIDMMIYCFTFNNCIIHKLYGNDITTCLLQIR